ncbi:MAG: SDR family oxidoreductase [Pseudohongiellaceae bacterium]
MATVLITGTNRGIGLEFVTQYIARGYRVIATCRNIEMADELRQLQMTHGTLLVRELDVAKQESIKDFAQAVKGENIDIFINNAGVSGPRDMGFGKVDARSWASVLLVNTIAPLMLTQALFKSLQRGGQKKLVYLSSKMGSISENTSGGSYVYRSSKTALNQVVKSLGIDLADEGFIAAALHPGWVLTDMGGPNALIDAATSVRGMMEVIDKLQPDHTGLFINYDGNILPW